MVGKLALIDEFIEAKGCVRKGIVWFPSIVVRAVSDPFDKEFKVVGIG